MGILADLRRHLEAMAKNPPSDLSDDSRDDTPTPPEGLRPCVECGTLVSPVSACGICARANPEAPLVILCSYASKPACTEGHARAQHSDGFLAERDPQWTGKVPK